MRFLAILLLLSSFALPAAAQDAAPLSGVWVPGELIQALEADAPREIPCYLVIEAEPLQVLEECGGGRSRWSGAVLAAERAGRLEVRAGEHRLLIHRAGTPNELELVRNRAPGEEPELVRLYRLPDALEGRLRSWVASQQLLVGTWRTEDGAEVSFEPAGRYRIAQESGRYRLSPGAPVAGSWGVLLLQPTDGEERIYLLAGAGRRIGLALPPAHLVPALREVFTGAAGGGGAGGQERGVVPGGQERGVAPGAQEPGAAPGAEPEAPGPADDGADGMGAGGAEAPRALPHELEVSVWLERTGPGVEQQATAPEPPQEEEAPQVEREPPPIAQPIEPRGRCGCGAAEGLTGLGLLAAGLAPWRRRQQDAAGAQAR